MIEVKNSEKESLLSTVKPSKAIVQLAIPATLALLDGQWLWFDATSDQDSTGEFGFLRFGLTELDGTKYSWDQEQVQWLNG